MPAASPIGLARPLEQLNGGLDPAPTVFFNATDADTGMRVWFSNNRARLDGHDNDTAFDPAHIQVGQAVLHSARFPAVSPAGEIMIGNRSHKLVDGGYADNSGTTALLEDFDKAKDVYWLNIDGKPMIIALVTLMSLMLALPAYARGGHGGHGGGHHANRGGHYAGGHGSSHKGGTTKTNERMTIIRNDDNHGRPGENGSRVSGTRSFTRIFKLT